MGKPITTELRSDIGKRLVDVIDGVVASRRGSNRTEVLTEILEEWAGRKVHEAKIVLRVAGIHPSDTDSFRNEVGIHQEWRGNAE